jgi:LAO/AO transport system kinase
VFSFHGHPDHAAERWAPRVVQVSALKAQGVAAFWDQVQTFMRLQRSGGEFDVRRRSQAQAWMWDIVQARLQTDFRAHPAIRAALPQALSDIDGARVAPSAAARALLDLFESPTR